MLIGYGDYVLTFAIGGSSTGAAFTAPPAGVALTDFRTGSVQGMQWIGGTQNTSSYVEITVTIASTLDATAAQGVVGVANVSLPEGTRLVIGGVEQRLVAGVRGERSAWALPFATGNSLVIRIYNDVNGVASIPANYEFSIGEIFVGRVIDLCTLLGSPTAELVDPTAYQRTAGGQLYQLMRKPYRQIAAQLGAFSTLDAKGGPQSTLPDGGNPVGVIDIQTLRELLATANVCAVCDTPTRGQGLGSQTVTNGVRFDKDFCQTNWFVARPISAGQLSQNRGTRWTWNPSFQEAS